MNLLHFTQKIKKTYKTNKQEGGKVVFYTKLSVNHFVLHFAHRRRWDFLHGLLFVLSLWSDEVPCDFFWSARNCTVNLEQTKIVYSIHQLIVGKYISCLILPSRVRPGEVFIVCSQYKPLKLRVVTVNETCELFEIFSHSRSNGLVVTCLPSFWALMNLFTKLGLTGGVAGHQPHHRHLPKY